MHPDDSVFENHTSGGRGVGKDAIRQILKGVFATFPDLRFEARRTFVRGTSHFGDNGRSIFPCLVP
jgi:predicted ester cyclase